MADHTGIYITLCIYLLLTGLVTLTAFFKNRKDESEMGEGVLVKSHFLGNKNFGLGVLYLTSFASIFSGYTVVGVPNDGFTEGYNGFKWIASNLSLGITMIALYPRLRRLSVLRNYESPGDFLMDRFNSVHIKVLGVFSLCIPQVTYIAVQFHSLGKLANQLAGMNFYVICVAAATMCLAFEFLGGMRSVAYTDAVEATVMIAIFIILPCMITAKHGGFVGQVADRNDQCANDLVGRNGTRLGCVNYATDGKYGISSFFTRSPSAITNINTLVFMLSSMSYPLNPFMIQRLFGGRSDKDVKIVTLTTFVNSYIAQAGGVLIGITVLANSMTYETEFQTGGGFFRFLNQWLYDAQQEGDTAKAFIMYLLVLAAMAGIMSTADSALIGVSNTFTVDIFRNWLYPNKSGKSIIFLGKIVSGVTVSLSLGLAMFLEATKPPSGVSYSILFTLQNGIMWQIVPAFFFGMYTSMSGKTVANGCYLGLFGFFCFAVYNVNVEKTNTVWANIDPDAVELSAGVNAFVGVICNTLYCLVAHAFARKESESIFLSGKNAETARYGAPLTHGLIVESMENRKEPVFYMKGAGVIAIFACLVGSLLPRAGPIDEALVDIPNYKTLEFNGKPDHIVAGLPAWALWQVVVMVIGSVIGLFTMNSWEVDESEGFVDGPAGTEEDTSAYLEMTE